MKMRFFRYPNVMALALLLLVVGGCQPQQTLDVVKPVPAELSVDAAKQYYEATKNRSKAATKYQFLWDLVKKIEVAGSTMITVPVINVGGGNTIIQSQNGQVSSSQVETGSAMFYLDGDSKITASLTVTELPLSESVSKNPQKMYFFSWMDESLQSVWTLNNGRVVQAENALDDSRARTSGCVAEIYMKVCGGGGQLGGGNNNPTGLGDPGPGCRWVLVGTMPCSGGGGNNPGGGDPITIPNLPSPFPFAPTGPPIVIGGGGPGGLPPTISQDVMTRIYVASKIGSWEAQGVHVTEQERNWLVQNPFALIPLDFFIRDNLAAAKAKLAFGIVGNFIRWYIMTSDFEKRMFDRYWSGQGGTYHMTTSEFNDAISKGRPDGNITDATFEGQSVYEQRWSWYASETYDFALGRGAVYIRKSDGTPFGYQEDYDFDAKPWGVRSINAEVATRLGANFVIDGAAVFTIKYP